MKRTSIGGQGVLELSLIHIYVADEAVFSTKYTSDVLPLVCVPTTSGTGSEVTPYAMIIDDKKGTKNNLCLLYTSRCV